MEFPTCALLAGITTSPTAAAGNLENNLANNWRLSISCVRGGFVLSMFLCQCDGSGFEDKCQRVCVCVIGYQGEDVCERVCVIQACSRRESSIHSLIYKWLHCLITDMSLTHAGTNEDCM